MEVRDILKSDRHSVVSVKGETAASEAARMMADKKIGFATVVDDADKLVGVLSERDLLGALAEGLETADRTTVDTLMTTTLVTCQSGDSVLHAIELMGTHSIRHLVVLEDGDIAGVLSSRDLFDIMARRIDERGLIKLDADRATETEETKQALSA